MEKVISILRSFNFTESEAKVYISLVENGPGTGYEISKQSNVARSKIYGILESLMQRGVLTSCKREKSVIYRAEPVDQLVTIIRNKVNNSLDELEKESCKLGVPHVDEQIWNMCDLDAVLAKCVEMIDRAEEQVMIQVWVNELNERFESCINSKQEELDKVLVIVYDAKEKYETNLNKYYEHGFEQNKLDDMGARWITVMIDGKEMLYASVNNNGSVDAIYTKNTKMVFFAQEYIAHDAYCLRLINHLREQVTTEFGTHMEGIRDIFTH